MRTVLNPLHIETMAYSFGWRGLPWVALALTVASMISIVTGSAMPYGILVGSVVVACALLFAETAARRHEKRMIEQFLAGKHLVRLPPLLDTMDARKTVLVELAEIHPHTHWIVMQFGAEVLTWCMENLHMPFGVVPIRGVEQSWKQSIQCYFATAEDADAFSKQWMAQ